MTNLAQALNSHAWDGSGDVNRIEEIPVTGHNQQTGERKDKDDKGPAVEVENLKTNDTKKFHMALDCHGRGRVGKGIR